jgi:hypothetical protein
MCGSAGAANRCSVRPRRRVGESRNGVVGRSLRARVLTTSNRLLHSVNMPGRPRHPKKEVEEALEFAEARGWLVESPRPGHPWGKATCGREGHDCLVWIWSTPKSAANHAKRIQRAIYRCDAKEEEGDDRA